MDRIGSRWGIGFPKNDSRELSRLRDTADKAAQDKIVEAAYSRYLRGWESGGLLQVGPAGWSQAAATGQGTRASLPWPCPRLASASLW